MAGERDLRAAEPGQGRGGLQGRSGACAEGWLHGAGTGGRAARAAGLRRLSRAQDGNLAGAIASNEELGRTFAVSARVDDALSKLTLEQVNAALRTYVKPDAFVSGFAGDFKP